MLRSNKLGYYFVLTTTIIIFKTLELINCVSEHVQVFRLKLRKYRIKKNK